MKFLCTADLHLGRAITLPEGVSQEAQGPSRAWNLICGIALDRKVDALLIAGDAIDSERSYTEGMAVFRHGLKRLQSEGIPVILTAGNHDWNLIAEAALGFPGVVPLGLDGEWETHSLGDVTIAGWSFPARHYGESPMEGFPEVSGRIVGLLHCDLAGGSSRYAPVSLAELESKPAEAWVLGHVHSPLEARKCFYPGAPVGLNCTETGPRSVVLMDTDMMTTRRIPLPVLEWREATITEADFLHPDEGIDSVVQRALSEKAEAELTGFRVYFQGRTSRRKDFREAAITLDNRLFPGGFFIQQAIDFTRPLLDVENLARGRRMSSLLARELQSMDPDSEEYAVGLDLLEELLGQEKAVEA